MMNGNSRPKRKVRPPRVLSAVELVQKFRISYQTLNHYTNLGLLRNATRKGIRRFYREDDVRRRLRTIKALQGKGYPLRLISERLNA
ncbi:MAG: MerR family transcriptional regulator [Candidatus Omnitrophica bacterium]|nr:MerR family transcriptional regulator [Candidatus Omnitrophota bacterium]MBI3020826.1 MerR family transcriptional regulator [Candidatus Omnitrophota bacterium]MBI3083594.1 MerR family transcriptional regulator [Candidatus Omnitrophota bacterium]